MIFVRFKLYVILTCVYLKLVSGGVAKNNANTKIKINKCCEANEIYQGRYCTKVNKTEEWRPLFLSENGTTNLPIEYTLVTGLPDCGHMQLWPIYHTQNSTNDRLHLLPNGVVRHFFVHIEIPEEYNITGYAGEEKTLYYDYKPGKYCLDKKDDFKGEFAWVCTPDQKNANISYVEEL